MSKWVSASIGALLSLSSLVATAGQFNNAQVSLISSRDTGVVRIILAGGSEIIPPPSCTTSASGKEFVINISTEIGKIWYSTALAALASGKKVHIVGSTSCSDFWNNKPIETVGIFYILQ